MLRVIAVVATTTAPLACARYEWIPDSELPACADARRPASHGPVVFERDSAANGNALRGRVIQSGRGEPIPGATVTLLTEPARTTTTDSAGTFTFTEVPAGAFLLRTRRIGYRSRADTLHLPFTERGGLALPLDTQMLDGPCSGFAALRVRKPWWKLW